MHVTQRGLGLSHLDGGDPQGPEVGPVIVGRVVYMLSTTRYISTDIINNIFKNTINVHQTTPIINLAMNMYEIIFPFICD